MFQFFHMQFQFIFLFGSRFAQNNFVCFHFDATFYVCNRKTNFAYTRWLSEHQKCVHDRGITTNYNNEFVTRTRENGIDTLFSSETFWPSGKREGKNSWNVVYLCKTQASSYSSIWMKNISRLTLLWIKHDDVGRFWHSERNSFLPFASLGSRDFVICNLLCLMGIRYEKSRRGSTREKRSKVPMRSNSRDHRQQKLWSCEEKRSLDPNLPSQKNSARLMQKHYDFLSQLLLDAHEPVTIRVERRVIRIKAQYKLCFLLLRGWDYNYEDGEIEEIVQASCCFVGDLNKGNSNLKIVLRKQLLNS